MKSQKCLLPGCKMNLTMKQVENQDLYCCDLHCKLHLEMNHPKSERVQEVMVALKAGGCPSEFLLEAIGETLIDMEKHKSPRKPVKALRLHNHPIMERQLKIPPGHVIIDADVFLELKSQIGDFVKPSNRLGTLI